MSVALAFAGASTGLSLLSGLFGYMQAEDAAEISESRGRMLLDEANAEAALYAEQATSFRASQAVAYGKAGVTLEGSPLDVLEADARTAAENMAAIQARGRAQQVASAADASAARAQGRAALIGGLASGASTIASAAYNSSKNEVKPRATGTSSSTGAGNPASTRTSGRRSVF